MSSNRLQPHFVLLCEQLNLDKLLPFLRQERMVTSDEYETLTNVAYTKRQKREKLLILLPRKGRSYFQNFGKCLVWSGQVELARHIGVDVESVPQAPYAPPPPMQVGPTSNQAILEAIQNLISTTTSSEASTPPPYPQHAPRTNPPSYQPAATAAASLPPPPPVSLATATTGHQQQAQQPLPPSLLQQHYNHHHASVSYHHAPSVPAEGLGVSNSSSFHHQQQQQQQQQQLRQQQQQLRQQQQPMDVAPPPPPPQGVPQGVSQEVPGGVPQGVSHQQGVYQGDSQQPVAGYSPQHLQQQEKLPVKIFILYCKDTLLQESHHTSGEEFCQDILELADILTLCGGLSCSVDFYEQDEQQNWNLWTQREIQDSKHVIMVCSPQLMQHLQLRTGGEQHHQQQHQQQRNDVMMSQGLFFSDMVVNSIVAPKFVPVFLNHCVPPTNPRAWLPPQLHAARHFKLERLRELFQTVFGNQNYSPEEQTQVLIQSLQEPAHREVGRLVRYLRGEREVVPPQMPRIPVPMPVGSPGNSPTPERRAVPGQRSVISGDYIEEAIFVKIAERLPQDWIHLGIKLGIDYTKLEQLRRKYPSDYLSASLEMFGLWQRSKGKSATRRALKKALVDMNFGRLAVECFPDVMI